MVRKKGKKKGKKKKGGDIIREERERGEENGKGKYFGSCERNK